MYKKKGDERVYKILDLEVVENWNMKWIISIQIPDSPPSRLVYIVSNFIYVILKSTSFLQKTHNAPTLKVLITKISVSLHETNAL